MRLILLKRLVMALFILVAAVAIGYASTNAFFVGVGTHLDASDGPEVVFSNEVEIENVSTPFPNASTVAVNPDVFFQSDGPSFVVVDDLGVTSNSVDLRDIEADNKLRVVSDARETIGIQGEATSVSFRGFGLDDGQEDLSVESVEGATIEIETEVSEPVLAVDEAGNVVASDDGSGDTLSFEIPAGEFELSFETPQEQVISNLSPGDGDIVEQTPVEIGAFVDTNTETTVEFVDFQTDEVIASEVITNSQDINVTWDGLVAGENQWFVRVTNEFGQVVESDVVTLKTPENIEIRDELTNELITDDSINITVRFFQEESEQVVTRSAEEGIISMEGLPIATELIVSAEADEFESRRIIIDSVVEQSTIYLLDETEPIVFKEISLEDRTREFDGSGTKLIIQKPIASQGEETGEFRTIAGDFFGAGGTFPVVLQQGDRYRLLVENEQGQRRSVGSHVAESDGELRIEIGQIEFEPPDDRGWALDARTFVGDEVNGESDQAGEERDETRFARVRYVDRSELTDSLTYEIRYLGNETTVHGPETIDSPVEIQDSIELPNPDANYEIVYQIDRDGGMIEDRRVLGGVSALNWPLASHWLQSIGLIGLVAIAGLFGGTLSRTGSVVVVVAAIGFTTIGVLSISPIWLTLAGVAALLFKFADGGGRL